VPNENGNSKKSGNKQTAGPMRRKLLLKVKDDILIQPKKVEAAKMTEKELERTKKWRDMAVIDRPYGSILYRFPFTKKVIYLCECIDSSWCNGRSREFLIAGG
jgi:hypothetical protein